MTPRKIAETLFEPTVFKLGPARFTVLTPNCIRMEYSKAGCFEDNPTLFATREHKITAQHAFDPEEKMLTIDTGLLKLCFTPDGKHKFNEKNLCIELPNGKTWTPGMTNDGNLGGTCKTLDNFRGEGKVGRGLLSHDGWFLIDDAPRFRGLPAGHVLKDGWIEQRPVESGSDCYFFWAHDTGGFMGDRNDELFVRWTQFCATAASLRLHSSCSKKLDRRSWKCGKKECDAARISYHLRSRLMPYIYSTVRQCYSESLPMIRPMYLMSSEETSIHLRATIQANANVVTAAFKRRSEALLGQPAGTDSWQDLPVDGKPEDVQTVLGQLAGTEPVPCISPIDVGEPFGDPDW